MGWPIRELDAVSLLIVAYLFLGGTGAGAFFVLACIDGRNSQLEKSGAEVPLVRIRRTELVKRGYVLAFAALGLGALCLLADLGRPEAAYLLFTRPTLSYISVGTYSLTVLLLCVAVMAAPELFALPRRFRILKRFVLPVGLVAALFVMTYTGIFLQSMRAVPLWESPLLVGLFVLSALSTGVALVLVSSVGLGLRGKNGALLRRLTKVDLVLIAAELVVAAAYLATVADSHLGGQSVDRLLSGDWSLAFVGGFALCGLVAPGVMEGLSTRRPWGDSMDLAIGCMVLVGGLCLRLSLVNAGIHSSI